MSSFDRGTKNTKIKARDVGSSGGTISPFEIKTKKQNKKKSDNPLLPTPYELAMLVATMYGGVGKLGCPECAVEAALRLLAASASCLVDYKDFCSKKAAK